jgi:hypothetical protein
MKINKKDIIKWSSKKETYYTYHNKELGELKIKLTERFNDKDEPMGVDDVRITKDNYSIPELVKEVYAKHLNIDLNTQSKPKGNK